jgi:hypothetical protein
MHKAMQRQVRTSWEFSALPQIAHGALSRVVAPLDQARPTTLCQVRPTVGRLLVLFSARPTSTLLCHVWPACLSQVGPTLFCHWGPASVGRMNHDYMSILLAQTPLGSRTLLGEKWHALNPVTLFITIRSEKSWGGVTGLPHRCGSPRQGIC